MGTLPVKIFHFGFEEGQWYCFFATIETFLPAELSVCIEISVEYPVRAPVFKVLAYSSGRARDVQPALVATVREKCDPKALQFSRFIVSSI